MRDTDTNQPIEQVTVRLIEDGIQQALLRTGKSGDVLFDVDSENSYLISVEPLSHYDEVAIVVSEELTSGVEYQVELPLTLAQETINLEAQLYDSLTKSPLVNTVVRLRHELSGRGNDCPIRRARKYSYKGKARGLVPGIGEDQRTNLVV